MMTAEELQRFYAAMTEEKAKEIYLRHCQTRRKDMPQDYCAAMNFLIYNVPGGDDWCRETRQKYPAKFIHP